MDCCHHAPVRVRQTRAQCCVLKEFEFCLHTSAQLDSIQITCFDWWKASCQSATARPHLSASPSTTNQSTREIPEWTWRKLLRGGGFVHVQTEVDWIVRSRSASRCAGTWRAATFPARYNVQPTPAPRFQARHGTSTAQMNGLLGMLRGQLGALLGATTVMPTSVSDADGVLAAEAGVRVVQLDGCSSCNHHVWSAEDPGTMCPKCNNSRCAGEVSEKKLGPQPVLH